MQLLVTSDPFFIFDLDDTLFHEIDYLKSAYRHIAKKLIPLVGTDLYDIMWKKYQEKENVFSWIVQAYGQICKEIDSEWLLYEYRTHVPKIQLDDSTSDFLQQIKRASIPTGLITDGRSITQRNKLKSLGLEHYFNDIIISEEFGSEKPDKRNYLYFKDKYPSKNFYFFGDNTSKDFIVPSKLGWKSICLKCSGYNIHKQDFSLGPVPEIIISGFEEISLRS